MTFISKAGLPGQAMGVCIVNIMRNIGHAIIAKLGMLEDISALPPNPKGIHGDWLLSCYSPNPDRIYVYPWVVAISISRTIGNQSNPCQKDMMTSSNGNISRVTDPLYGKFTGDRWIPLTKASDAELWCFLWSEWTLVRPVIWDAIALIITWL